MIELIYRKEIDGLRAVAVLSVIFFHAGLLGFSGGYVGVDVFFVISGYLITSIILDDLKAGQFSILRFYERRARRIMPALTVVLMSTTILAFVLMPADLLKEYSQSLMSVALFLSNVFFYLSGGYFSTASEEKPLLHTWSLAVEEQYYIFFPAAVFALWRFGRLKLTGGVTLVSALSLLTAQLLSNRQAVDANFYLIFSRAWEILAGALIVFANAKYMHVSMWKKEILGATGLLSIVFANFFFTNKTPVPGFWTLVPVVGSMLVVAFGDKDTLVGKLLSAKAFVVVGLGSYSLYLWHQPIFAFLRMKHIGEPSKALFLFAIILTFAASLFTYKYIERPFRDRNIVSGKNIFRWSGVVVVLFLFIGGVGYFNHGFQGRFDNNLYLDTVRFSPKRHDCHTSGIDYLKPSRACRYFGKSTTWAVLGDSHTVEPAFALAKILSLKDDGILHLSFSACPPALLFATPTPGCSVWIGEALAYLEKNDSIKNVLIGFRYESYLRDDRFVILPDDQRSTSGKASGLPAVSVGVDYREIYWNSFSAIVARLLASGKKVYVMYPIPELPVHIAKAISPISIFSKGSLLDLKDSSRVDKYFADNSFILRKLDTLPYGLNLQAIKPFDILCTSEYCPAVKDGKALYFDDDHLSLSGADEVIAGSIIAKNLGH